MKPIYSPVSIEHFNRPSDRYYYVADCVDNNFCTQQIKKIHDQYQLQFPIALQQMGALFSEIRILGYQEPLYHVDLGAIFFPKLTPMGCYWEIPRPTKRWDGENNPYKMDVSDLNSAIGFRDWNNEIGYYPEDQQLPGNPIIPASDSDHSCQTETRQWMLIERHLFTFGNYDFCGHGDGGEYLLLVDLRNHQYHGQVFNFYRTWYGECYNRYRLIEDFFHDYVSMLSNRTSDYDYPDDMNWETVVNPKFRVLSYFTDD